jgi:hypothetical protein
MTRQNGIHSRFERELFAKFRARVTVAPPSIPPVRTPRDFAFDTILESSQLAGQVLKADAAAAGARGQYDEAYYEAFFAGARPVLERGINTAIAAVAAMITGAWEAAGKPRSDPFVKEGTKGQTLLQKLQCWHAACAVTSGGKKNALDADRPAVALLAARVCVRRGGGIIHVLLVIALVLFIVNLISGRRPVV